MPVVVLGVACASFTSLLIIRTGVTLISQLYLIYAKHWAMVAMDRVAHGIVLKEGGLVGFE